jgi:hypothetical protein
LHDSETYLFDVHGYIVIENALTNQQLEAANAAIDTYAGQINIRPTDLARGSSTLAGSQGRGDLSGLLTWDRPHCDVFRDLMVSPRLRPYLETLLGPGFRLEACSAITMDEGAEGFWFHEGGEPHDRSRGYYYQNGRSFAGMTNVAVQLTDVGPEDGGFACLPGSHRANYPCPDGIRLFQEHKDRIRQIEAKAGDAILFVETLMHGALPWRAKHQRRTVLFRYNSAVTCENLMGTWVPPDFYDELSEEQQAVIAAPKYQLEDKGSKLYTKSS